MQLLSYYIPEKEITTLKDKVIKKIKDLGYDLELLHIKDHITIVQIKDEAPLTELYKLLKDGKNFKSEFKIKGISIFPGSGNLDYVALDLDANKSFNDYVKHISDNKKVEVVSFPGGFKPHISICTIPKRSLTTQDSLKISDLGEDVIIPTKIQLWGKDKRIIKEIVAEIIINNSKNYFSNLLDLERHIYSNSEPTHTITLKKDIYLNRESIIKKVTAKLYKNIR